MKLFTNNQIEEILEGFIESHKTLEELLQKYESIREEYEDYDSLLFIKCLLKALVDQLQQLKEPKDERNN